MTNGPEARLAETLDVNIPRPRSRETIIYRYPNTRDCATTFCIFCCAALMPSRRESCRQTEGIGSLRAARVRSCLSIDHLDRGQGRSLLSAAPSLKGITMITRSTATEQILAAKQAKGLTFEAIAEAVGRHKVWVTAALMGQATMSSEESHAAVQVLGVRP